MNNPIITASGPIPAYACVKVSITGSERVEVATSAADVVFGVTLAANTPAGGAVNFQTTDSQLDIFTLKAAGPIAIGQYVVPTTNGTVIGATTGPFVALDPATIGQTFTARKFNAGATANFLAPGTGATTRTLDSKLRDTLSVKDFGAVGDGVTNDTAALQAALDAQAGGSLYIPAGVYITTSALNISTGTYVYGDYTESVIAIQPTASATTFNNCFEFNGDDITVDGIKTLGTNEGASADGINFTGFAKAFNIVGRTRPTIKNCEIVKFCASIFCTNGGSTNSNTITITGNRIWGGIQPGDATVGNDAQDILVMGSPAGTFPNLVGRRSIISNNYCLGNVDCGINVTGNSGDTDFVVSGNIIQPLDLDGITSFTGATVPNNKSRYGIIAGYIGVHPSRCVVSGNIVRDYGEAGIVSESQDLGGGQINITGNIVSNCGFSVVYPSSFSLKAGINVVGSSNIISNNIIADCFRVGIQYIQNNAFVLDANNTGPVISGNSISNIDGDPNFPTHAAVGYGISVGGNNASGALVANNRIARTFDRAIQVSCSAGATNGNCTVTGNLIDTNHAAGLELQGIVVINSGGLDCLVSNNKINGSSKTSNTGSNIGIFLVGTGPIHTIGNVVNKYFIGVSAAGFTAGRNLVHQCTGNVFTNCGQGIANSDAGPWLISDNVFKDCTAIFSGGVWQGTPFYKGTTVANVLVSQSAVPTTGTWAVGDRVVNSVPAVLSPKGWICTVAGTPGTWVSEGAL